MALEAAVHKADLAISDLDRHYYAEIKMEVFK